MIIKKAEFLKSYAFGYSGGDKDEICVVGRSNVGKSSFINALCNNGKLAKASSTPGRTRLINVFSINGGEFNLVDLPGYGYAKASKTEKETWDELMGHYFENANTLKQVIVLTDIRNTSEKDRQMLGYLYYYQIPFTVLATKCDKVTKSALHGEIGKVSTYLGLGRDNIIPFSAVTKFGLDKVLARLDQILHSENSN
ncbi:MAG: YihA family ribosome biogenesis GTP-binding protein [Clostridiales bacterium]|nr:YihA family ribosome biogenesis GTP-binding protein [Clostridiales bacterium]